MGLNSSLGLRKRIEALGLCHVRIHPFAHALCPITLQAHPDFERAQPSRLLESVNVELKAIVSGIPVVDEVGRLETERRLQAGGVPNEDRADVERRIEPFMWVDRDRVRELERLDPGTLSRHEHPAPISRVDVKPHVLPIGDRSELAQWIDGAGVRRSCDPDEAHRLSPGVLVLGDRGFERIEPEAERVIGRKHPKLLPATADCVDSLVDRDMALL